MSTWQIHEAKSNFTKLLEAAELEPQFISRYGVTKSVVISLEKYRKLTGKNKNFVTFIRNSPLHGVELKLDRNSMQTPKNNEH